MTLKEGQPAQILVLLGTVISQGNSQFPQNYGFADMQPKEGANYYRLKMTDKLGHFSYSGTVQVNFSLAIIQFYPNPAQHLVFLKNNVNFTNGEPIRSSDRQPSGPAPFCGNLQYRQELI